jgi:hypothetical protein
MPGTYDLTIKQGDSLVRTFKWLDVNKVPVDVSAYSALFHIYNPTTLATILDISSTTGAITLSASGEIAMTITAVQTAALTFDFARFYLRLTTGTTVKRLLEGWVTNVRS